MDSILTSTKLKVGLSASDTSFDDQIISDINMALFALWQLGVGKDQTRPFRITDASATWSDFVDEGSIEICRDYVAVRVQLIFDPPSSGVLIEHLKEQMKEWEWRMTVAMDAYNQEVNNNGS